PTGGALYRNPRRSPRHSLGHGAGRRTVRSGTAAAEARNRVYEPVSSVGHEGCPRPAQSGPHRRSGSRAAAAAVTPDDRIAGRRFGSSVEKCGEVLAFRLTSGELPWTPQRSSAHGSPRRERAQRPPPSSLYELAGFLGVNSFGWHAPQQRVGV